MLLRLLDEVEEAVLICRVASRTDQGQVRGLQVIWHNAAARGMVQAGGEGPSACTTLAGAGTREGDDLLDACTKTLAEGVSFARMCVIQADDDDGARGLRVRGIRLDANRLALFCRESVVGDCAGGEVAAAREEHPHDREGTDSLGGLVLDVAHELNNSCGTFSLHLPWLGRVWKEMEPLVAEAREQGGLPAFSGLPEDEVLRTVPDVLDGFAQAEERITRLVHHLMDYVRGVQAQERFRLLQLNEVIIAALELTRVRLQRHTRRLEVVLEEDLPRMQGDFRHLERVFVLLLVRACQLVESRSQGIEVRTRCLADQRRIEAEIWSEGTGPGSCPADEALVMTEAEHEAWGLDSSVCQEIIGRHGGSLRIHAVRGEGSRTTLLFPF